MSDEAAVAESATPTISISYPLTAIHIAFAPDGSPSVQMSVDKVIGDSSGVEHARSPYISRGVVVSDPAAIAAMNTLVAATIAADAEATKKMAEAQEAARLAMARQSAPMMMPGSPGLDVKVDAPKIKSE